MGDAPVAATCRIASLHSLDMPPASELGAFIGLGARSAGNMWHTPPSDPEEFLRQFTSDSPLSVALQEFFYGRRKSRVDEALREESRRDPVGSVLQVPGPLRPPSVPHALPPGGKQR